MVSGAESVKIDGKYAAVRAQVSNPHMPSAHADANEILVRLGNFTTPPGMTFVTGGGPEASDALRHHIEKEFQWRCTAREHRERSELKWRSMTTEMHNPPLVKRAKRLGIDTQHEADDFMRNVVLGALCHVTSDLLDPGEMGLSEIARRRLERVEGNNAGVSHPQPIDSFSHVRGEI